MTEIFIEAESFTEKGGWVVDQQSMETIHSSYLMAHGMGVPVEDAYTEFEVMQNGVYYVWCLTRDWTAVWNFKESAGKFKLIIDENILDNTLGTNGKEWGWQLAGQAELKKGTHKIYLKDLAGFNARCDAIYITDSKEIPQSSLSEIDKMRKRLNWIEIKETDKVYDLVVVGGGIAGICTALSAIRQGLKTVLINDRPVLGGCNSSEVRVCAGGHIKLPPYENIGDVVREVTPVMGNSSIYKEEYFEDKRKLFAFEASGGDYDIMLCEAVSDAEKENDKIVAVVTTNIMTGKKTRIKGKIFSDCSGDAVLARFSGAQVMYGRESEREFGESLAPKEYEKLVMGHSIRWTSEETENISDFPDIDWDLQFDEKSYLNCFSGDWEQEAGFRRDMVSEIEYIRDYGLRAIYSNWSYQKNHCKTKERFEKSKLKWVSYIGGKRESYRVVGDYVLTQHDLEGETEYDDATAGITWGIDIHFPEPSNEEQFGEAFRSFAYHRGMPRVCFVPYRCLYSKDIKNLFIGGRLISTSHVGFSAVRVMRTLGMLGEVAGLAAALCKKYECFPRDIYERYLDELKQMMKKGVNIPVTFAGNGIGEGESYHFKDIGWWYMSSGYNTDNDYNESIVSEDDIKKFKYNVKKLGIKHKYQMPEKWDV